MPLVLSRGLAALANGRRSTSLTVATASLSTPEGLLSGILFVAGILATATLVLDVGSGVSAIFGLLKGAKGSTERSLPGPGLKSLELPALRRHVDVDTVCPVSSHTPGGESDDCELCCGFGDEGDNRGGIRHGHLKRTLPCGCCFHGKFGTRFGTSHLWLLFAVCSNYD